MATNENLIPIPGRLHSVATEGHVAGADEIYDDTLGKLQSEINQTIEPLPDNVAYLGDDEGQAVIPGFDPQTDTLHKAAQVLTTAEKDQVAANLNNRPATNGMARIELKATDNFKSVVEAQTGGNTVFVIKYDYTLTGDVTVPANCMLEFDGGSIANASGNSYSITGNNTKIIAGKDVIFDSVVISGTWNIPVIYSSWVKNVTSLNNIGLLSALSNDDVQNTIIIEKGEYLVSAEFGETTYSGPFLPKSNSHIILNGNINLQANNLEDSFVVDIVGKKNIIIEGSGSIVGDKTTHTGSTGEKGHGLVIRGCRNITIKGITIKDCWGDCLYIGTAMKNYDIIIDGCTFDNGRRQGVSVVNAIGYHITNCIFTNIAGTAPQFGIDIEPNAGGEHHCYNGVIENCRFITNLGVYVQSTPTNDTQNVVIRNNYFDCLRGIDINGGTCINVYDNQIEASGYGITTTTITNVDLSSVIIRNNKVYNLSGNAIAINSPNVVTENNESHGYFSVTANGVNTQIKGNTLYGNHLTVNATGCVISGNYSEYAIEVGAACTIVNNIVDDYIYATDSLVKNNTINISTLHEARQYSPILSEGSIFDGNIINFSNNPDSRVSGLIRPLGIKQSIFRNNKFVNAPRVYCVTAIDGNFTGVHLFEDNDFDPTTSVYNYASVKDKILFKSHVFNSITRPSLASQFRGIEFFDFTLGKPIYWTENGWVDATGATV